MNQSLVCFRRKTKGPRGGEKIVHCVELNGSTIFDGATRREAQDCWSKEKARIEREGGKIDWENVTRDWYGKF